MLLALFALFNAGDGSTNTQTCMVCGNGGASWLCPTGFQESGVACDGTTSKDQQGCTLATSPAPTNEPIDSTPAPAASVPAPDPVPNGDGSYASTGNPGTLRRVVSDWIAGGTLKDAVVAKYGEIENWSTSEVTNLKYVFYGKSSFNADISKWVVSSVTSLESSKSCLANC